MNNVTLILFIILFIATTLAEKYVLIYFGLHATREQYISMTLLSLAIFILALKNPLENPGKISGFLTLSGKKHSLGIYIIHPLILTYIVPAAGIFGITLSNIPLTIAAFAASWLIVAIYYFVKEKVWLFYKTKRSKDFVS